jgi:hypothetical protein
MPPDTAACRFTLVQTEADQFNRFESAFNPFDFYRFVAAYLSGVQSFAVDRTDFARGAGAINHYRSTGVSGITGVTGPVLLKIPQLLTLSKTSPPDTESICSSFNDFIY